MNEFNYLFMRIQIFENQDQYDKFWKYTNSLENYEEKISQKHESKYYALIKFSFHNCVPLNILIQAIANKFIEVQNSLIRTISIEILQHFQKLKTQQIQHGNITTKNIIIELQDNSFFDEKKNNIEIKNIYFTNYIFSQQENDERNIKDAFLKLWKLIQIPDTDSEFKNAKQLEEMSIQEILQTINQMYVQDGKTTHSRKIIGNLIKQLVGETKPIKILGTNLKGLYPKLQENLEKQIQEFANKNNDEFQQNQDNQIEKTIQNNQSNSIQEFSQLDCGQLQQTQNLTESNVDQKGQNEEKINRNKCEQDQQNIINNEQQKFLDQVKDIHLQNFIENAISFTFETSTEQQKFKDEIDFKLDKCYINIQETLEILLGKFGGIQQTLNQKQKEINDFHYQNFKFQIDLTIQEIVKVHFDQFLSITQHYIFQIKEAFDAKIQEQHELIKKQLDDAYDAWITLKILELISDLI